MDPLRTLLVGLGARGRVWARLLDEEPRVNVVGYVDRSDERLARMQETGPAAGGWFTSLAAALGALRPDLVVLATPPMDRFEDACTIFDHGAHLLSEKPLAVDIAEAIRIVEAAEGAGRTLTVAVNFRYQHCVARAREIFRGGEIGAPEFARYVYWRNRDGYRPGLNRYPLTMLHPMLYEQTIHHLDTMRFVYDAELERVSCRCHNPTWSMYRHDATVSAVFEFAGGIFVTYIGTWSAQTKMTTFEWRTDCGNGALVQREMFADLHIARGRDAERTAPIELPYQQPLVDDARLLLAHVAAQLQEGVARPHPSGADHLRTLGAIAACEESHRTGRAVVMEEFYARHDVPAARPIT
ncbi:MAG TPA: Gfo/Idh/MocA family oxidoreductase [bacterium]|nr:Gfo/Idh/MocA family oxidoreductase [bacterium]